MKENKTRMLVFSLIAVIVLLLGFVMYSFVIRPAFTGYATNAYNQGLQVAVSSIMQQVTTCQPVPLTIGETTIPVMAVGCPSCSG